jgi:hypothetical protein
VPVIVLLLIGGATIPLIAGPGVELAAVVLLVAGAGAITYLWYRFTR